ncbi:arylsulfatase B-like [Haemaphysalis longicornis]
MTGLYAIHTGLQHLTLSPAEPFGMPLDLKILPQHLQDLGYETHMVGKWNLGHSFWNYTPIYRGFDSFYGMHCGPVDYYTDLLMFEGDTGIDLWHDKKPVRDEVGEYVTQLVEERAEYIIANRNKSKPLFLYLAHQAPHSTFGPNALQAPDDNVNNFHYIRHYDRTTYAGMMDALDKSIGALMEALEAESMLENTIIVFSSDNGGDPYTSVRNTGYNWPLRGIKSTLWEGSVRVPAFLWNAQLVQSPRVSNQLMHVTDWLPTLYSAAGT